MAERIHELLLRNLQEVFGEQSERSVASIRYMIWRKIQNRPPDSAIELSAWPGQDCLIVEVADQGPGIPPEALERVFTRYRADVQSVSGVYRSVYAGDDEFKSVLCDVKAFEAAEGRRPRMLVVKLGQDGHDRGMKVIATAFKDQ
jgi:hypothetical protein